MEAPRSREVAVSPNACRVLPRQIPTDVLASISTPPGNRARAVHQHYAGPNGGRRGRAGVRGADLQSGSVRRRGPASRRALQVGRHCGIAGGEGMGRRPLRGRRVLRRRRSHCDATLQPGSRWSVAGRQSVVGRRVCDGKPLQAGYGESRKPPNQRPTTLDSRPTTHVSRLSSRRLERFYKVVQFQM